MRKARNLAMRHVTVTTPISGIICHTEANILWLTCVKISIPQLQSFWLGPPKFKLGLSPVTLAMPLSGMVCLLLQAGTYMATLVPNWKSLGPYLHSLRRWDKQWKMPQIRGSVCELCPPLLIISKLFAKLSLQLLAFILISVICGS